MAQTDRPFAPPPEPPVPEPPRPALVPVMEAPPAAVCPYCAVALVPPPTRSRSCPHCRRPIAVRHHESRLVLLAEDAVAIFDGLRQQEEDEARWTTERAHWLTQAGNVSADPARRARLAAAPISGDVVADSRSLYLTAADAAVRKARGEKRWKVVSRIRRNQAANLYAAAGRPVPPPDDVIETQREALLAELHGLQTTSKVAELASAGCCPTCRQDDGRSFMIAAELRTPRLPHAECPKGLCGCDWFLAKAPPKKPRRRKASTTGS